MSSVSIVRKRHGGLSSTISTHRTSSASPIVMGVGVSVGEGAGNV